MIGYHFPVDLLPNDWTQQVFLYILTIELLFLNQMTRLPMHCRSCTIFHTTLTTVMVLLFNRLLLLKQLWICHDFSYLRWTSISDVVNFFNAAKRSFSAARVFFLSSVRHVFVIISFSTTYADYLNHRFCNSNHNSLTGTSCVKAFTHLFVFCITCTAFFK